MFRLLFVLALIAFVQALPAIRPKVPKVTGPPLPTPPFGSPIEASQVGDLEGAVLVKKGSAEHDPPQTLNQPTTPPFIDFAKRGEASFVKNSK
uniref:Uncharacterized protein n=1 Tax=Heterorhabditis bacteriophora TaxID=37862 RepID=A0A1I7XMK3_HETBA